MDGVKELVEVHNPNNEADDGDDIGQLITERVNLLLQRSVLLVFLSGLDFSVNGSDSGVHSSARNNSPGCTLLDVCGREDHVLLILKHGCFLEGFDVLGDLHGLSSQRGLGHLECHRLD